MVLRVAIAATLLVLGFTSPADVIRLMYASIPKVSVFHMTSPSAPM